jgi:hypothetical protein
VRKLAVFTESFLDGFTMAGFLNRLERPGAATQMFAASDSDKTGQNWEPVTFEPSAEPTKPVVVAGGLRAVPEQALQAMMELLKREDEDRKRAHPVPDEAAHGTSH